MSTYRLNLFIAFLIAILCQVNLSAQDAIPEVPNPPRLVNDFAGILSSDQVASLEQKLVAFNDTTSTQIAVVIMESLSGYDPSDFAQRLGAKWGVGGAKFNNGFVILVKPKTASEKGEAFIASGYGVEGNVPDATAWDIVNNEMIPYFRQNDYYGGINAAVETLFKFTSGEFKASSYGKSKGGSGIIVAIILFILAFFFFTKGRNNRNINRGSTSSMLWPFLFGASSGGNWGNFSGGSGGFGGGGGGGFGGFGGGGFGGGGAGGSW
ncbi:MAG: TPM domain-containing protein [Bacteroidales bacterium]|nr:TPM domain-containing protein [Bacteroidales bacterium]